MNFKKFGVVLGLILSCHVFAQSEKLTLHLECDEGVQMEKKCIELEIEKSVDEVINIYKEPSMVIEKKDIENATISDNDDQFPVLSIQLTSIAGDKFRTLTANNIDQRLAVVSQNKVVMAPVIKAAIEGGNISIGQGRGVEEDFNQFSWIKEMALENAEKKKKEKMMSLILYILIGLGVIAGGVYYAFIRPKRKN